MQRGLFVRAGAAGALVFVLSGAACSGSATDEQVDQESQALSIAPSPQPAIDPVIYDEPGLPVATCPPPPGTRPDPTVVNTDPFVLARFPLQRVVDQLITLSGVSGQTGTQLYKQLWDSIDKSSNALFPGTPHCDDGIGNFPFDAGDCPRSEAQLKNTTPPTFRPIALFNRFDLAPKSAENCGEYRIIYAQNGGPPFGRNFVIFEGVLPNPDPSCGIESCRPVVKFWESLASFDPNTAAGQQALADKLDQFYFAGLPGFQPVVHPDHYGASGGSGYGTGPSGGQIRLNMFVGGPWQLREHHLVRQCTSKLSTSCRLVMQPVTVKNNPFRELFKATSAWPLTSPFELGDFPPNVRTLADNDVNLIGMSTLDQYNAPQSTSQSVLHDYKFQYDQGGPPNAFTTAVSQEITNINRPDLTPHDIMTRATTQSCAGCHQLTNNLPLSNDGTGGPIWPSSLGFVHVDEQSRLSPALWCSFLPFRKKVLDNFANSLPLACTEAQKLADVAKSSDTTTTVAEKPAGAN